MSLAYQFYIATLLVYAAVYITGAWGLNFQFGVAGVFNFGYILTIAAGAYGAAITSIGAPVTGLLGGAGQRYFWGASWPYPLPLLFGAICGMFIGGLMGLVSLRRLRSDYQAITTLIMSLIATDVITNSIGIFNGASGLTSIPNPMYGLANGSVTLERWYYVFLSAFVCLVAGLIMRRLMFSPLGRALRALRDNATALEAFGRTTSWLRVFTFLVGGFFGGLSGALLVQFIGAWSPAAWLYAETFVLFTAIIVGGTGSFWGAGLGAVLLPVLFAQVPQFFPAITSNLVSEDAFQWIIIGLLAILFMWFRPQGALPERTHRIDVGRILKRSGLHANGSLSQTAGGATLTASDLAPAASSIGQAGLDANPLGHANGPTAPNLSLRVQSGTERDGEINE